MNKRQEQKLRTWCEKLYQNEAKNQYADWLRQTTAFAAQDAPDIDEYWDIKKQIFKAETHWEICYGPRSYWPKDMRNDSFQVSCQLHKAWLKTNSNNK